MDSVTGMGTGTGTGIGSGIAIGAIDDDQMFVQGMAAWIGGTGDLRLAATGASVEEYLAAAPEPGIVTLDLHLHNGSDPVDNVAALVGAGHQVIVVTVVRDQAYISATTEAGAAAYLTKNNNLDALAEVVRALHRGDLPTTPEHAFWLSRDDRPTRPRLSPRESEILRAVGEGMLHETIGRRLGIGTSTVRSHLKSVRAKYAAVGRDIKHPAHYRDRVREDDLSRERLDPNP